MAHLEVIRPAKLSRWQRFVRSITLGPYNPKDREIARAFGGRPVTSGVTVTEDTVMSYSAVWAAVNLVSGHIASVPLVLYRVLPDGGKQKFVSHPLYRLVHDRPNPLMGSAVFRRAVQANKMVWGNGYAEIERDGAGRPVNLWPLLSYQMQPFFDGGQLFYRYRNPGGTDVTFEPRDVLHLRGHSETGIDGVGAAQKGRESFGVAIAAERFGAAFFGNGATFDHVITYPPGVNASPQTKADNQRALDSRHKGVDRSYRMLALYEGATVEQMGVPPNEAQFLETRMFQIEEVSRWFNIPPHKLKHLQRTSYNSIEHQSIEYVTDALDPDWVQWDQELNLKLVSPLEASQQRIEHVREGMLRGDSTSRSELQSKQFSIGGITTNEVREQENRNPVKGGDVPFVALNMIPMDLARPYWEAQIDKAKQPPAPINPPPKADDGKDDEIKSLREQLALARHAASLAEQVRDARQADVDRLEIDVRSGEEACAALTRKLAEVQQVVVDMVASEQALIVERDAVLAERDTARAEVGAWVIRGRELEGERDAARQDRDATIQQVVSTERARDAAVAERDTALILAEEAQTARNAVEAAATAANDAMNAAESRALEAIMEAGRARDERTAAISELATVVAERDGLRGDLDRAMTELAAAGTSERDAQAQAAIAVSAAERERDEARQQADVTVAGLRAELEHARADVTAARQESAGAALALDVERQQRQAERAAALASMRALFADATNRLLTKEALSARKHQTTAEKLRVWVDSFYPLHEDLVRSVFLPLVAPWTALAGGDARDLLDALVRQHVAESERAMRQVLEVEDEDERAATLERTLRRWEDERANVMADALVREGMGR